tara:strand:- start:253 stop:411 length:159 start_codon:yes stop_codon:yes gene_type:complete
MIYIVWPPSIDKTYPVENKTFSDAKYSARASSHLDQSFDQVIYPFRFLVIFH